MVVKIKWDNSCLLFNNKRSDAQQLLKNGDDDDNDILWELSLFLRLWSYFSSNCYMYVIALFPHMGGEQDFMKSKKEILH